MSVETQSTEHIGETAGAKNHDHDLVHDLSRRLDAVWRYDQYIANAEGIETDWGSFSADQIGQRDGGGRR